MIRRIRLPPDPQKLAAAVEALYLRYAGEARPNPLFDEEGRRRPLRAGDPAQAEARIRLADAYGEAGGETEVVPRNDVPPEETTQPCPSCFQFQIADEDGGILQLRDPLQFRVYDESGALVKEGTVLSGGTITVDEEDLARRYSLWIDGEYVTFHDDPNR